MQMSSVSTISTISTISTTSHSKSQSLSSSRVREVFCENKKILFQKINRKKMRKENEKQSEEKNKKIK